MVLWIRREMMHCRSCLWQGRLMMIHVVGGIRRVMQLRCWSLLAISSSKGSVVSRVVDWWERGLSWEGIRLFLMLRLDLLGMVVAFFVFLVASRWFTTPVIDSSSSSRFGILLLYNIFPKRQLGLGLADVWSHPSKADVLQLLLPFICHGRLSSTQFVIVESSLLHLRRKRRRGDEITLSLEALYFEVKCITSFSRYVLLTTHLPRTRLAG